MERRCTATVPLIPLVLLCLSLSPLLLFSRPGNDAAPEGIGNLIMTTQPQSVLFVLSAAAVTVAETEVTATLPIITATPPATARAATKAATTATTIAACLTEPGLAAAEAETTNRSRSCYRREVDENQFRGRPEAVVLLFAERTNR